MRPIRSGLSSRNTLYLMAARSTVWAAAGAAAASKTATRTEIRVVTGNAPRAQGVGRRCNASFAPDRRQNHSSGWLIIKRAATDYSLSITVGPDRPGHVRKRALAELADQNSGGIDRPRHDGLSGGNSFEPVPP